MNRVGRQFWWDTPQIYDAVIPVGSPANITTLVSVWRVRIQFIASSIYHDLVLFCPCFLFRLYDNQKLTPVPTGSDHFSVASVTSTAPSTTFTCFAKNAKFGQDLYQQLVAPVLSSSLLVETWIRGSEVFTNCTPPWTVRNVNLLNFAGNVLN
jgi:hypothetical protein